MLFRPNTRKTVGAISLLALALATSFALPAYAHVKWFAPYIVGAAPQPVGVTLRDEWFWLGIILTLGFFIVFGLAERRAIGIRMLDLLDRATNFLWIRIDDYIRAIIGVFFISIFSVGGIYLTPDLKTPAEWVSWVQLLIAWGVFWRATMPLSALGIVFLWLLALRDYDLFHLLDYLALGLGVAAYLLLAASNNPKWSVHRLEALRWGLAIALMWSSLEKFAYPEWFYPLVIEKPFLTFGLPRDAFIPMAGVAEFTMGFGLLWTPLIRRLSAIALFVIFTAAVWPFGRIDLIGHGLIMAVILAVAADHSRESHFLAAFKNMPRNIPVGLSVALVTFVTGYWGLHAVFYGAEGYVGPPRTDQATHSHNLEQPHGPEAEGGIGAPPTK